ncbi:transposase (fragment) [Desulfosarcina cetonica]
MKYRKVGSGSILQCLAETSGDYKKELDALLALNFQSFSKSQIITV